MQIEHSYIFHLILVGIPSSFILAIKNRGGVEVGGGLLNEQNLLSMTKVIC